VRQRSLQRQGRSAIIWPSTGGAWSSSPDRSDNRAGGKKFTEANLKSGLKEMPRTQ